MPRARVVLLIALAGGCSAEVPRGGDGGIGAGDGGGSGDSDGGGCGSTELAIEAVPPNLLVMLDRSCSMRDPAGGNSGATKWHAAVGALTAVTGVHATAIRWGLGLFPDLIVPDCRQGTDGNRAVTIRAGAGTAGPIAALLGAALAPADPYYPDGPCVTNIDWAMKQASLQPELDDPARTSFVMLVTDGRQADCDGAGADAGTEAIITELHDQRGVGTFVVGFGAEVDASQLDRFALLGGHPRPAPPYYYQANVPDELDAAVEAIARETISCDLAVADPPADPDRIYVFVNDAIQVPRDPAHADGWDYDPATMTLTFYGPACAALRAGDYVDIDLVAGCPAPAID